MLSMTYAKAFPHIRLTAGI